MIVARPCCAWPLYSPGGGEGKWAFYTILLFRSALSALTAIALLLTAREPDTPGAAEREEAAPAVPPAHHAAREFAFLIVARTGHFAMGVFEVLVELYLRSLGTSMRRHVGLTWIAFSLPMTLAFIGGHFADRYNRWALMFVGYTISALCYVIYGSTANLTLFLFVSVIEGFGHRLVVSGEAGLLRAGCPAPVAGQPAGHGVVGGAGGRPHRDLGGPAAVQPHVRLRDQLGWARLARRAVLRGPYPLSRVRRLKQEEKRPRRGWLLFPWRSDPVL